MTLPGFNAETSTYKSRVPYRLMGPSVWANGAMLQQIRLPGQVFTFFCAPCSPDDTGACVQNCTFCFGSSCSTFTEPCDPSTCPPPNCTEVKNNCMADGGSIFDCSSLVLSDCIGCDCCPPCCFKCM